MKLEKICQVAAGLALWIVAGVAQATLATADLRPLAREIQANPGDLCGYVREGAYRADDHGQLRWRLSEKDFSDILWVYRCSNTRHYVGAVILTDETRYRVNLASTVVAMLSAQEFVSLALPDHLLKGWRDELEARPLTQAVARQAAQHMRYAPLYTFERTDSDEMDRLHSLVYAQMVPHR